MTDAEARAQVAHPPPTYNAGVLIIGGGYAGLHAADAVRSAGVSAMVVDRSGRHDFVTRLAAVAGGTMPIEDAFRPVDDFVRSVEAGTVAHVGDGSVRTDDGRTLTADAVVVTVGSETARPPVDGIEQALGLRTSADATELRKLIDDADSLVIVGGGATGIQLAGAAAHAHPGLTVHLFEADDRLLYSLPAALGGGAERILRGRGVEVRTGRQVERITDRGVVVDGETVEGLVVWAGGFSPDAGRLGVATDEDGRITIDGDLRITGFERTFAAGDIAGHRDASGDRLPMSAQIAVRAGTLAGQNAVRLVRGEPTEEATLRQLGWVLDLGGHRGVAQLGPVPLAGPVLDLLPPLLHDAIDLKNLVEIGGISALQFAPAHLRRPVETVVNLLR